MNKRRRWIAVDDPARSSFNKLPIIKELFNERELQQEVLEMVFRPRVVVIVPHRARARARTRARAPAPPAVLEVAPEDPRIPRHGPCHPRENVFMLEQFLFGTK